MAIWPGTWCSSAVGARVTAALLTLRARFGGALPEILAPVSGALLSRVVGARAAEHQ